MGKAKKTSAQLRQMRKERDGEPCLENFDAEQIPANAASGSFSSRISNFFAGSRGNNESSGSEQDSASEHSDSASEASVQSDFERCEPECAALSDVTEEKSGDCGGEEERNWVPGSMAMFESSFSPNERSTNAQSAAEEKNLMLADDIAILGSEPSFFADCAREEGSEGSEYNGSLVALEDQNVGSGGNSRSMERIEFVNAEDSGNNSGMDTNDDKNSTVVMLTSAPGCGVHSDEEAVRKTRSAAVASAAVAPARPSTPQQPRGSDKRARSVEHSRSKSSRKLLLLQPPHPSSASARRGQQPRFEVVENRVLQPQKTQQSKSERRNSEVAYYYEEASPRRSASRQNMRRKHEASGKLQQKQARLVARYNSCDGLGSSRSSQREKRRLFADEPYYLVEESRKESRRDAAQAESALMSKQMAQMALQIERLQHEVQNRSNLNSLTIENALALQKQKEEREKQQQLALRKQQEEALRKQQEEALRKQQLEKEAAAKKSSSGSVSAQQLLGLLQHAITRGFGGSSSSTTKVAEKKTQRQPTSSRSSSRRNAVANAMYPPESRGVFSSLFSPGIRGSSRVDNAQGSAPVSPLCFSTNTGKLNESSCESVFPHNTSYGSNQQNVVASADNFLTPRDVTMATTSAKRAESARSPLPAKAASVQDTCSEQDAELWKSLSANTCVSGGRDGVEDGKIVVVTTSSKLTSLFFKFCCFVLGVFAASGMCQQHVGGLEKELSSAKLELQSTMGKMEEQRKIFERKETELKGMRFELFEDFAKELAKKETQFQDQLLKKDAANKLEFPSFNDFEKTTSEVFGKFNDFQSSMNAMDTRLMSALGDTRKAHETLVGDVKKSEEELKKIDADVLQMDKDLVEVEKQARLNDESVKKVDESVKKVELELESVKKVEHSVVEVQHGIMKNEEGIETLEHSLASFKTQNIEFQEVALKELKNKASFTELEDLDNEVLKNTKRIDALEKGEVRRSNVVVRAEEEEDFVEEGGEEKKVPVAEEVAAPSLEEAVEAKAPVAPMKSILGKKSFVAKSVKLEEEAMGGSCSADGKCSLTPPPPTNEEPKRDEPENHYSDDDSESVTILDDDSPDDEEESVDLDSARAAEQKRHHAMKQGGRKLSSLLKPGGKKPSVLSGISEKSKPAPQPKPVVKKVVKEVTQTISLPKLPLYEGARSAQGGKYAALSEHFEGLSAGLFSSAKSPATLSEEELAEEELREDAELDALDNDEEEDEEEESSVDEPVDTKKKNQPDALQNVMRALDKVKYRLLQDYKVGGNQRHQLQRRQQVLTALKPRVFSTNPHKIVPRDVISFRQSKLLSEKERTASHFWRRLETTDLNKDEQIHNKKNPFKMFELARDLKNAAREVEFLVSPEFNERCRGLNGGSAYLAERGLESNYCQDMLKGVKLFLEERFMA